MNTAIARPDVSQLEEFALETSAISAEFSEGGVTISYGHTTGQIMSKLVAIDYMLGRDTIVWRWEKLVVTIGSPTALVRGTNIVQIMC